MLNLFDIIFAYDFLSIHDNSIHPSNIGSFSFDGEGTPTRDLCLLKDGILQNFIHSEATAKEFGVLPTGHAGLGAKVSVSPDCIIVSKSKDVKSLYPDLKYKETKEDYVLIENLQALHAGVKASQGSF